MNESDAKAAFRAMGITRPSRSLIEAWLRAAEIERQLETPLATPARVPAIPSERTAEAVAPPATAVAQRGKSLLEPILRELKAIKEPSERRKPGRPRIVASWFPAVAETMADGTTLRTALAIHSLNLSTSEVRALYRNRTFKGLYQEARRRYLLENWGRSKRPSLRALLGRAL